MLGLVVMHFITNFEGYRVNILPNNRQFAHFDEKLYYFWTYFWAGFLAHPVYINSYK